jgi:hypothetical protein
MDTPHAGGLAGRAVEVGRLLLDGRELSPFSPFPDFRIVTKLEGALMVVGLGLCLARPRRPIAAFLLGWLAAGLASLLLDGRPNQLPHVLLVSCLPAAFCAVVLEAWQSTLAQLAVEAREQKIDTPTRASLVAACAAPLVVLNGAPYFARGAGAPPWSVSDITALGEAMQEYRDTHHVALVTPRMSWDINSTLLYLAPDFKAPSKLTELDPREPWLGAIARDVAFLVMPESLPMLVTIRTRYPNAPMEVRRGTAGEPLLVVLRVPAEDVRRAEAALSRQVSAVATP